MRAKFVRAGGWVGVMALAVLMTVSARGDDPKPEVESDKASEYVGRECVVKLTVAHSKDSEHRKRTYLDSKDDYKDAANFTVIISHDHLDAFREAGVDHLADYYLGKTLKVSGKVIREEDQTRIHVESPKQIEVISDKKG